MKYFLKITMIIFLYYNLIMPQDNSFIFTTKIFQPYFPAYIGNGHFSLSSSPLGVIPAESYMINVYDHAQNDIPRIAALPEWNEINIHNGASWLNESANDTSAFKNFEQKLDMYNGTLESNYVWSEGKKNITIKTLAFISRSDKNLAVIKLELTADFSDSIKLSFPLKERVKPERMELAKLKKIEPNPPGKWPAEWYPGFTEVLNITGETNLNGGKITSLSRTEGRITKVAQSIDVYFEDPIESAVISYVNSGKKGAIEITFSPEQNKKYTFYKLVSIISENEKAQLDNVKTISTEAKKAGFEDLYNMHKAEWNRLWETDIILEGDDELQKIVHSMMFYILCSIDDSISFSIPPMGLATSGYYGHIFWDADTYMFPPLLFMHPGMAQAMVMFRYNTLDAAKENAKLNKYEGAMYPWESDELGKETTPFFAYQNALMENHIVGDVAFAQWQYFLATKDTAWLREYGSKVIEATADFWVSRVHFNNEKDRYEIGKIVSVSEGIIDINNETYTNSIAKINLDIAVKTSKILGTHSRPQWALIRDKMFIPYNKEKEFHPTYENAGEGEGATELWSSVVNLLSFPLQVEMSENAKRNNLTHAVKSIEESGAGAMMGTNFVAIIAAELDNDSLFNAVIERTLKGYLRPPFNVMAETHTNNSINFITGAGSFLQQVIFGYTGLRLTDKGMVEKYPPMLPKKIKSLTLKNFTVNNKKVNIAVDNNKLTIIPIE